MFVDEGPSMTRLLERVKEEGGRGTKYASALLAASGAREAPYSRPPILHPSLAEPLSDRELEVLGLIADGYSNREIAEKLVITVTTVKKHAGNIFGKLGVSSRTQAISRARDLGLT